MDDEPTPGGQPPLPPEVEQSISEAQAQLLEEERGPTSLRLEDFLAVSGVGTNENAASAVATETAAALPSEKLNNTGEWKSKDAEQPQGSPTNTVQQIEQKKIYTTQELRNLLRRGQALLRSIQTTKKANGKPGFGSTLEEARELAARANLSIESDLPRLLRQQNHNATDAIASALAASNSQQKTTTASSVLNGPSTSAKVTIPDSSAGYSNTDHTVVFTGSPCLDVAADMRRRLLLRFRYQCPEQQGSNKWDKPRLKGERRRRIVRETDKPNAPPVPPPTGYVHFISHRTLKWRHDNLDKVHDQSAVVREMSKVWRIVMSSTDQQYYNDASFAARTEYQQQLMEFRATGTYTPSETFKQLEPTNTWVYKDLSKANPLEQEIQSYKSHDFPVRPAQYDAAYAQRNLESKARRKQKLQQQWKERQQFLEDLASRTGTAPPRKRRRKKRADNVRQDDE